MAKGGHAPQRACCVRSIRTRLAEAESAGRAGLLEFQREPARGKCCTVGAMGNGT